MSKSKFLYLSIAVLIAASLILAGCQSGGGAGGDKLEIFSWWTAGGEAEGLNAMFEIFSAEYPDVEIVNATVAGGAGTNAKAVLATRLQGGDPPDSFQVHAGLEVEKYEPSTYLQPIEDMYDFSVFPKDLLLFWNMKAISGQCQ